MRPSTYRFTLDKSILRFVQRQALSLRGCSAKIHKYDGWLSYTLLASVRPDSSDSKGNSPNPFSSSAVQVGEQRGEFRFASARVLSCPTRKTPFVQHLHHPLSTITSLRQCLCGTLSKTLARLSTFRRTFGRDIELLRNGSYGGWSRIAK